VDPVDVAVRDTRKAGRAYVVVDGTLIAIDRVAANRPSTPASTKGTA
jgi:predicted GTPase